MDYDVRDLQLAQQGKLRIQWAGRDMPVLRKIRGELQRSKPLEGVRISCCLHVTTETANLMVALQAAGAQAVLCASNPLSTQDDVAAALVKFHKIPVFAIKGEDTATYYDHIRSALEHWPQITMDDGADLVSSLQFIAIGKLKILHSSIRSWYNKLSDTQRKKLVKSVIGGTEETTTGVIRLKAMERDGVLRFPVIAVNEAHSKYLFDNRYGTGQSTIDGILRATNRLYSGSVVVVSGYGWCGRGVAMRARGMGARVLVTEVNPHRALEAVMDGYQVMSLDEAAEQGDIFVTTTGDINVISRRHFLKMKDGAIVSNAGHFNVEIDIKSLEQLAQHKRMVRPFVEEYKLKNGRCVYLLGQGRLINLAAAEGHPSCVMDLSFTAQALCAVYMRENARRLHHQVYRVPEEIDEKIARLKLQAMGIKIDTLTKEQERYLHSWQFGTE